MMQASLSEVPSPSAESATESTNSPEEPAPVTEPAAESASEPTAELATNPAAEPASEILHTSQATSMADVNIFMGGRQESIGFTMQMTARTYLGHKAELTPQEVQTIGAVILWVSPYAMGRYGLSQYYTLPLVMGPGSRLGGVRGDSKPGT